MLARRLIIASGGGGTVVLPPPAVPTVPFQVIDAPDAGGWTEANSPHALYADGRTWLGWVGGNSKNNDIEVAAYVHATETVEGPVLLKDNLNDGTSTSPDSHNAPSVLLLASGALLVAYCGHNASLMTVKRSNAAVGPGWVASGFTAPITVHNGGEKTYPVLAQLGSRVWLYWRDRTGSDSRIERTYSDDDGDTWSSPEELYEVTAEFVYFAIAQWGDRVHFAVTDAEPEATDVGTYYVAQDEAGDVYRADGTEITGFSYPLAPSDLDELEAATGGDKYPYSISPTSDDRPVISWQTKKADPVVFGEFRSVAGAYVTRTIGTSDPISPSILSTGGGHHVWGDADRHLQSVIVGSDLHVIESRTDDDGATWDEFADHGLGSSPVYVREGDPIRSLWFEDGTFTGSDDFDPGLIGLP